MTTTFSVSGGNATLKMVFVAPVGQITAVMDDACHALWLRGMGEHGTDDAPVLYASLTLAQKEAIVDQHTMQIYLGLARQYKSEAAAQAARDAAAVEAKTRYGLGA